MSTCLAITKKGTRCTRPVKYGAKYCGQHASNYEGTMSNFVSSRSSSPKGKSPISPVSSSPKGKSPISPVSSPKVKSPISSSPKRKSPISRSSNRGKSATKRSKIQRKQVVGAKVNTFAKDYPAWYTLTEYLNLDDILKLRQSNKAFRNAGISKPESYLLKKYDEAVENEDPDVLMEDPNIGLYIKYDLNYPKLYKLEYKRSNNIYGPATININDIFIKDGKSVRYNIIGPAKRTDGSNIMSMLILLRFHYYRPFEELSEDEKIENPHYEISFPEEEQKLLLSIINLEYIFATRASSYIMNEFPPFTIDFKDYVSDIVNSTRLFNSLNHKCKSGKEKLGEDLLAEKIKQDKYCAEIISKIDPVFLINFCYSTELSKECPMTNGGMFLEYVNDIIPDFPRVKRDRKDMIKLMDNENYSIFGYLATQVEEDIVPWDYVFSEDDNNEPSDHIPDKEDRRYELIREIKLNWIDKVTIPNKYEKIFASY